MAIEVIDIAIYLPYPIEFIGKVISKSYISEEAMALVITCILIDNPMGIVQELHPIVVPGVSVPRALAAIRGNGIAFHVLHIHLSLSPSIESNRDGTPHGIGVLWIITGGNDIVEPTFAFESFGERRVKAKSQIGFLEFGIRHDSCNLVVS